MGASYNAKDSTIFGQQLLVQELVVRYGDGGLYSVSGSVVTVNFNEPIEYVACALRCKDATPSVELVAQASIVITTTTVPGNFDQPTTSTSSVAFTLASAFATNDCLIIKYAAALS